MEEQTSHIRVIVEDKTDNTIKVIVLHQLLKSGYR